MTRKQQLALWRSNNRRQLGYRRKGRMMFSKAFDDQVRPLFDKLNETSDIRDFDIPALNNVVIESAYNKLYQLTARDFAISKRKELKDVKSEDDIFDSIIRSEITAYVQQNTASMITVVGDTSLKLLQDMVKNLTVDIIDQGIGGGEAVTMLRDQIQSGWHEIKRYRVERIIRTEVNRAANFGSYKGAENIGMMIERVWMSAFAAESRSEHMAANGQAVKMDEPFIVGGDSLLFPGDVSLGASAGNTINCLCSMFERPVK